MKKAPKPKFKVGSKVRCVEGTGHVTGPQTGGIYPITNVTREYLSLSGLPPESAPHGWYRHRFVPASAPKLTKAQREIERKRAELAKLEEAAALAAKEVAEKEAKEKAEAEKREKAKLMAGLYPSTRRVVAMLRENPSAFGCNRPDVIRLAAAICGDTEENIRRALA